MAKRVYISPSDQVENKYAWGNTNEHVQCQRIAEAEAAALRRCGVEVQLAKFGTSMAQRCAESNAFGADIHNCVHTNAFNQQTNVDLSNKYIVLDLSELKGKLLPVGMMIALDYVWDKIKSDRTKKKAIMIDEIWLLIGAGSNRMAAEFCLEIFKVIRGFGGAAISATQDLSDFFGLEDGRYGRAIINNSKNKIILNLEPDEAEFVRDTLKLTKTEIRSITRFERGEALICSNNSKVPVIIKASKEEQEMITTDRAELEAILKERQQEAD